MIILSNKAMGRTIKGRVVKQEITTRSYVFWIHIIHTYPNGISSTATVTPLMIYPTEEEASKALRAEITRLWNADGGA